jgi:hypothetical protein
MGFYINRINDEILPAKGKADALIAHGATEIFHPIEFQENLVCVVENAFFDAAGYIFDSGEFGEFMYPDSRNRRWLIVPNAPVLSGYTN